MKYITILIIFFSNSLYAQKIEGNNCLNLAKIQSYIEFARDNKISKKDFVNGILNSKELDKITKQNFIFEVDFIYNLPKNHKYSKITFNECLRKGYVVRKEA